MTKSIISRIRAAALGATALCALSLPASADQVFADDIIVQGSACIGQDCVNGESFGFDTLRLKENNLRIKAQDTSNSSSFPTNDWQITFNDSTNGGSNKFSIDDIDNGRTPFTITAAARSNSIFVNNNGNVGFGTATPAVTLHARSGNSPTLRLEQDGSSGFTAQTWDVAGNEANFFIRDASNGSTLPLRIQPGAPTSALYIANNGNIGMGAGTTPDSPLHVSAATDMKITMERTSAPASIWEFVVRNADGDFAINNPDSSGADFIFRRSDGATPGLELLGDVRVSGSFIANGTTLAVPDYVFEDDYALMPLNEVRAFIDTNSHLPSVPSAAQVQAGGLDLTQMQLTLLKKIEELTLYTLAQEDKIARLEERLDASAN